MDAALALRELAEPWPSGSKVKSAIERAARRVNGMSYWRAFDIWYGKARRIEQIEADLIAVALAEKRKEAARNELHELRTRLVKLESILARADEDFYRPRVAAVGDLVRSAD
jgi:Mg2+ and Co2+ transporter CorA